jgi:hypothetical protein
MAPSPQELAGILRCLLDDTMGPDGKPWSAATLRRLEQAIKDRNGGAGPSRQTLSNLPNASSRPRRPTTAG